MAHLSNSASKRLVSLLLLFAGLFCSYHAAAEPTAEVQLSQRETEVGQILQMNVVVDGRAEVPPAISVDGADVQYRGPSHQRTVQIENGRMSESVHTVFIYQLIPRRPGKITIPALTVNVDGKQVQTEPVDIAVAAPYTPQNTPQNAPPDGPQNDQEIGFSEIVVPKNDPFVGESMPVEVRLYIDTRVRAWRIESIPDFQGDGFTKQKFPNPREESAIRDGKQYRVIVFRTAITPSRAGKMDLGPCEVAFDASLPRPKKTRPRNLLDDFLGDDFFNDPFGQFTQVRRIIAKAEPVQLNVRSLPHENQPANFSGAVGQFSLGAEARPPRLKVGDPLTMVLRISGRGNFDRVQVPAMKDPAGWHAYPATDTFAPDDEIRTSGTKTFELAVVPEAAKTSAPLFDFSYFDPSLSKYVTLTSNSIPITVEGAPLAPPKAPAATPATSTAEATKPAEGELLEIQSSRRTKTASFKRVYEEPAYWWLQGIPLFILIAVLGWRLTRKSEAQLRQIQLRREKAEAWSQLQQSSSDEAFLDNAVRFIQLDVALSSNREVRSIDESVAISSRPLDAETAGSVERMFSIRSEVVFAGLAQTGASLDLDRQHLLNALRKFESSHA